MFQWIWYSITIVISCEDSNELAPLKEPVSPKVLCAVVFVLKFGWRVCGTFRKLYPAALAFQQADIYSSSLWK